MFDVQKGNWQSDKDPYYTQRCLWLLIPLYEDHMRKLKKRWNHHKLKDQQRTFTLCHGNYYIVQRANSGGRLIGLKPLGPGSSITGWAFHTFRVYIIIHREGLQMVIGCSWFIKLCINYILQLKKIRNINLCQNLLNIDYSC